MISFRLLSRPRPDPSSKFQFNLQSTPIQCQSCFHSSTHAGSHTPAWPAQSFSFASIHCPGQSFRENATKGPDIIRPRELQRRLPCSVFSTRAISIPQTPHNVMVSPPLSSRLAVCKLEIRVGNIEFYIKYRLSVKCPVLVVWDASHSAVVIDIVLNPIIESTIPSSARTFPRHLCGSPSFLRQYHHDIHLLCKLIPNPTNKFQDPFCRCDLNFDIPEYPTRRLFDLVFIPCALGILPGAASGFAILWPCFSKGRDARLKLILCRVTGVTCPVYHVSETSPDQ